MATYTFGREAGHRLQVTLSDEPDKAAVQLKERLEELELTNDHFRVSVEGSTVVVAGDSAVQDQKEKILLALGNVEGVTAVEDRVTAGQEGIVPRFLTVQDGETLHDVAGRAYAGPDAVKRLLAANRPALSGADGIYAGLVVRAPA
ncbi:BON domain-containing protein [Streptomyces kunmingensis]|uniref:BON domain-containing protein n=1 Tax=Streptomyces kunmingensis TaxID=68225 RepID=A0ABU6C3X7_9ACTN|nr:BON domain-containing protein [Streptomyces kunmingensis]MEB3958877.1 BON domain-containing protein [Streptomyces kunmingensis]